jgi:hypothetical protein
LPRLAFGEKLRPMIHRFIWFTPCFSWGCPLITDALFIVRLETLFCSESTVACTAQSSISLDLIGRLCPISDLGVDNLGEISGKLWSLFLSLYIVHRPWNAHGILFYRGYRKLPFHAVREE